MEEMTAAEFREKHAESPSTERKSTPRPSTRQKRHSSDTEPMRRLREADRVSVVRDYREDAPVRLDVGLETALEVLEECRGNEDLSIRLEISIGKSRG